MASCTNCGGSFTYNSCSCSCGGCWIECYICGDDLPAAKAVQHYKLLQWVCEDCADCPGHSDYYELLEIPTEEEECLPPGARRVADQGGQVSPPEPTPEPQFTAKSLSYMRIEYQNFTNGQLAPSYPTDDLILPHSVRKEEEYIWTQDEIVESIWITPIDELLENLSSLGLTPRDTLNFRIGLCVNGIAITENAPIVSLTYTSSSLGTTYRSTGSSYTINKGDTACLYVECDVLPYVVYSGPDPSLWLWDYAIMEWQTSVVVTVPTGEKHIYLASNFTMQNIV